MIGSNGYLVIIGTVYLPPNKAVNKILLAENRIKHHPSTVHLIIIQSDPDASRFTKQLVQQAQTRPHHGAPLVVTQAILDADRVLTQPLLHHRAVHVVVVAPPLVARVVGRVDEHTVDPARIHRQQRLQRVQVVPVDNQVAVEPWIPDRFRGIRHQRPVWNGEVMIEDEFFTLEAEFRHKRGGEVQGSGASSHLVMHQRQPIHQYRKTAVTAVAKDNQNGQINANSGIARFVPGRHSPGNPNREAWLLTTAAYGSLHPAPASQMQGAVIPHLSYCFSTAHTAQVRSDLPAIVKEAFFQISRTQGLQPPHASPSILNTGAYCSQYSLSE